MIKRWHKTHTQQLILQENHTGMLQVWDRFEKIWRRWELSNSNNTRSTRNIVQRSLTLNSFIQKQEIFRWYLATHRKRNFCFPTVQRETKSHKSNAKITFFESWKFVMKMLDCRRENCKKISKWRLNKNYNFARNSVASFFQRSFAFRIRLERLSSNPLHLMLEDFLLLDYFRRHELGRNDRRPRNQTGVDVDGCSRLLLNNNLSKWFLNRFLFVLPVPWLFLLQHLHLFLKLFVPLARSLRFRIGQNFRKCG